MFRNHLKLAYRNLLKSKYTSAINLTGLVVGMTAALLIWQYVAFENSYDDFNEKAERIVRVRTDRVKDGEVFMQFAAGAACAGPVIHKNFEEVEDYLKLNMGGDGVYANGDRFFKEENAVFAAHQFFDFFSLPMLQGNPETCLKEPFSMCLSEKQATKYFGTENPIGKTLKRNGGDEFKVTGVFADWPENSHHKPDILLSYITYSDVYNDPQAEGYTSETSPYWDGFFTYLLLQPGTDVKNLESKIPRALEKEYPGENVQNDIILALQPLQDIHLTSHYLFEAEANGDATAVRSLLIIGLLVLLIAWFNYVNLSTARAETRAREVGVRKVIGSTRGDLIRQFILEAAMLNLLAIAIAFAAAQILLPSFENLAGKKIPFTLLSQPELWVGMLGLFLIGTLLAGLYPAFVLSSFRPADALAKRSSRSAGGGGSLMRKGLVVAQFATSVMLIVGTIVIFQQLSHMRTAKLGVDIDQTLVVNAPGVVSDSLYDSKFVNFKNSLLQLPEVSKITGSTDVPGKQVDWTAAIRPWGGDDDSYEGLQAIAMDHDFIEQYDLELVTGRIFNGEMSTDSASCVLNEQGVLRLGLGSPEEALGTELDFWGDKLTVVGVVKNFHQQSPKLSFESLILRILKPGWQPNFYSIKMSGGDIATTLNKVESRYSSIFPGNPFEYYFLDDQFAKQFEADQRLGNLTALFAGLAIFVSCLGLFALAAFVAERRTKEIGIRKVLGASVESLVALLSKEFIILVGVAILIATPLSWYAMNEWLANFEMRIDIQWWVFLLAGLAAILIAFVTMSFQSIKAALVNPIQSLRSE